MVGIIPLALAMPAAAAGAAYLDAKYSLSYDAHLMYHIFSALRVLGQFEKSGRHNLFFRLEEGAAKYKNHPFLMFEGQTWTYRQAYETVLRYATWLKRRHGVAKGDVVAIDMTNCAEFIWLWYGLHAIGATPAFINFNLTGQSLSHCVKISSAKLLLVDPATEPKVTHDVRSSLTAENVQIAVLDDRTLVDVFRSKAVREPDSARLQQKGSDIAMLIFTSGTTGLPKAAYISWNKANRASFFTGPFMGLKPSDRFFSCLPLFHSACSLLCVNTAIAMGSTIVLGRKFSQKTFWPIVRATKTTVIQYIGEICRYLLAAPADELDAVNDVRLAYGNGLRPDIWNEFKRRFDVPMLLEFYGATEGPAATYNLSRGDFSAGAVGRTGSLTRALFGSASAIVKIDPVTETPWRDPATGFCERVNRSAGESGELLNNLPAENPHEGFQGYYGNEKATSSKILRDVFAKGDVWYRTGDLIRSSDDGMLYFVDRIGDTFRWKGENCSTNEISEALGRHVSISEANVYGVQLPHHDGRAGCAAVVLRGNRGKEIDRSTLESLGRHVTDALPRYAVPLFLRVTEKLETTGTSKHMKHVLRNEGADPAKVAESGDDLYWLKPGGTLYVPFELRDWSAITDGSTKL